MGVESSEEGDSVVGRSSFDAVVLSIVCSEFPDDLEAD